jgi:roadblock/LC7 domain-containing protein
MKNGRIVNYHGRGRKKTAKIAAQIHAVGTHLANMGRLGPRARSRGD